MHIIRLNQTYKLIKSQIEIIKNRNSTTSLSQYYQFSSKQQLPHGTNKVKSSLLLLLLKSCQWMINEKPFTLAPIGRYLRYLYVAEDAKKREKKNQTIFQGSLFANKSFLLPSFFLCHAILFFFFFFFFKSFSSWCCQLSQVVKREKDEGGYVRKTEVFVFFSPYFNV